MKILTLSLLFFSASTYMLCAQTPSADLTVTLPSGKVLTFQTTEQKAAFLSARDRSRQPATAPAAASPRPSLPPLSDLGHTALDERPSGTGTVNVSAPVFTADYYLPSAETWEGKPITLSVAYVIVHNEPPRADGLRQLEAVTMGILKSTGAQDFGGNLTILATPDQARRIITQCGTTLQDGRPSWKTTLIHGEFTALKNAGGVVNAYGLAVTE